MAFPVVLIIIGARALCYKSEPMVPWMKVNINISMRQNIVWLSSANVSKIDEHLNL